MNQQQNKSIKVVEEQMEWLQQTYPKVFGQKMSSIVESTLRNVAQQSKEEERESLIKEFERLKGESKTVRDMVYLDGVIAVISTNKELQESLSNTP